MLRTHCSTPGLVKAAATVGCCQGPNVNIFEGVGHRVGQAFWWHQHSLPHCDRVQMWWHFVSAGSFCYSFPAFYDEEKSVSRVHFQQQNGPIFILFWCFQAFFFPTEDHLSLCHPRNKTKGQTQRTAWIIACPQLEKHGMQLFSSHLHNRPRNTERLQKVFHCLCWVLMIRQYIWAHQTQLTSPDGLVFELKNIKQENRREQTTALIPRVPVTLTPYGVCNENGI